MYYWQEWEEKQSIRIPKWENSWRMMMTTTTMTRGVVQQSYYYCHKLEQLDRRPTLVSYPQSKRDKRRRGCYLLVVISAHGLQEYSFVLM
jgi:hypothetical protein